MKAKLNTNQNIETTNSLEKSLTWIRARRNIECQLNEATIMVDKLKKAKEKAESTVEWTQKQVSLVKERGVPTVGFAKYSNDPVKELKFWSDELECKKNELNSLKNELHSEKESLSNIQKNFDDFLKNSPIVSYEDLRLIKSELIILQQNKEKISALIEEMLTAQPAEIGIAEKAAQLLQDKYNQIAAAVKLGEANAEDLKTVEEEILKAGTAYENAKKLEKEHHATVSGLKKRLEQINQSILDAEAKQRLIAEQIVINLSTDFLPAISTEDVLNLYRTQLTNLLICGLLDNKLNLELNFSRSDLALEINKVGYGIIKGFNRIKIIPDEEMAHELIEDLI